MGSPALAGAGWGSFCLDEGTRQNWWRLWVECSLEMGVSEIGDPNIAP